MTQEELNALVNEFYDYLANQQDFYEIWPSDDDTICVDVTWGDWKHDHLRLDNVAKEFFEDKGYDVINMDTEVTDEDGSDSYSATHSYRLRKHDEESKDESLNEETDKDEFYAKFKNSFWNKDDKRVECADEKEAEEVAKYFGLDDNHISGNEVDGWIVELGESLKEEETNSKVRLENPRLVSWKEMYLNDVCDGDEERYEELYADMYEDDEFGDTACQAFFDVVDDKNNYLGKLGVYKFDTQTWVYEVGFEPNERYLNKDKLELEDLDLPVDGWFDEKYIHKDIRSEEEYRELAKQFLPKIENAIEYSNDNDDLED